MPNKSNQIKNTSLEERDKLNKLVRGDNSASDYLRLTPGSPSEAVTFLGSVLANRCRGSTM